MCILARLVLSDDDGAAAEEKAIIVTGTLLPDRGAVLGAAPGGMLVLPGAK